MNDIFLSSVLITMMAVLLASIFSVIFTFAIHKVSIKIFWYYLWRTILLSIMFTTVASALVYFAFCMKTIFY
jgi:ABC-type antimicrobial peptide transport system permease subunit